MPQDDHAKNFVRQNILLLTSPHVSVDLIKEKKAQYFHRHKLKSFQRFKNSEIAKKTIEYLIEASEIKSVEDLNRFSKSSNLLSKYLHARDFAEFEVRLEGIKPGLIKIEDLPRLSKEEFIQQKTKEFLEIAIKDAKIELEEETEQLKKLKSQMESEKAILEKFKTELDNLPEVINPEEYITRTEEQVAIEQKEGKLLWWEKLGLVGDPFPTKLGLNRIPEDRYEEIVVKTKIFGDYLQTISYRPEEFFGKTIILSGQFGSGKTTLFQYISHKLSSMSIYPIPVILDPMDDPDMIRRNMLAAIHEDVSGALRARGSMDPRAEAVSIDKSNIASLLDHLKERCSFKGYFLSIDGLHKAETTLDSSLEFVKQLQNFHEYLDQRGINIAILIAASPYWKRILTQNPSYSGSYYRIDEIPPISFEDAYSLLEKRFKTYMKETTVPIFFNKRAIEFAYKYLSDNLRGAVYFRDFIEYVLPRLERGEYEEAGISVSIDIGALQNIDKLLKNSAIKKSYLIYRGDSEAKPFLRKACARVLEFIYKNSFALERDILFSRNKGAFWLLKKSDLIQKVRAERDVVAWGLSKDLLTALESLNEIGIPPGIIFRSLNMDTKNIPKKKDIEDSRLTLANNLLATWESEWPEIASLLQQFINNHKILLTDYEVPAELLTNSSKIALEGLVNAIKVILGSDSSPLEWTRNTWLDLQIPDIIEKILIGESPANNTRFMYLHDHYQSAEVLLEILSGLLNASRVVNLAKLDLGWNDLRVIYEGIKAYNGGDLIQALDIISGHTEKKIRSSFHLTFSLHYGTDYARQLPPHIRERIEKIPEKGPMDLKRGIDFNLFYHCSRSEYADLINNNNNWKFLFQKAFHPHEKEEVYELFQKLFALDDRRAHRDRHSYFREHRERVKDVLVGSVYLFASLNKLIEFAVRPPGLTFNREDKTLNVRISFQGDESCHSSKEWAIDLQDVEELSKKLLKENMYVDLLYDSVTPSIYGVPSSTLCVIASVLVREGRFDLKKTKEAHTLFKTSLIKSDS